MAHAGQFGVVKFYPGHETRLGFMENVAAAEVLALRHAQPAEYPAWLWPNLLGLDAPVIALIWQDYLARHYALPLHPAGRAVLGLTVWAIYLADHLLDVRHSATGAERARHAFCRRHTDGVRVLLLVILGIDFLAACSWVRPVVFEYGLMVAGGVAIYFAGFPLRRFGSAAWKKPVAGFLFTAGSFLVAWIGAARPLTSLGLPAAAFFALCLANLLMVESWEHGRELNSGWIAMAILCLCCLRWYWPVSVGAAALAGLSLGGRKISTEARCALADAVLLSPLLFR